MIDTNNKLNTLSKSLLESVRGVMEGKKVDQDKDGDNDFDDVQVARYMAGGMSKKEAIAKAKEEKEKGVDEETQVDELYKTTLKSYIKKAGRQAANADDSAEHLHGLAAKWKEKMPKNNASAKAAEHEAKSEKRLKGIRKAVGKLDKGEYEAGDVRKVREEVEQIDEASIDTLKKLHRMGKEHGGKLAPEMMARVKAARKELARRGVLIGEGYNSSETGREIASAIIAKMRGIVEEEVEQIEEVEAVDEGILKNLFKKKPTVTKAKLTSSQEIPDGEKPFQKLTNTGTRKPVTVQRDAQGRTLYQRVQASRGVKEDVESIEEALDAKARFQHHHDNAKALLKSIGEHLKNEHESAHKYKSYRGDKGPNWGHVGSMEHIANQLGQIHDQLARKGEYAESVEMEDEVTLSESEIQAIDELSKGTLASYVKKAAGSAAHNAMEHGKKKAEQDEVDRLTNRHMSFGDKDKIHKALKTTHRDVEEPREKAGKRIAGINKAINKLTKEETEIEEGRLPKGQKAPGFHGDEPRAHIIQQLQRAKLSMGGGATVKFHNGDEEHVAGHHASKLLDRYSGLKPQEKETFQKKIGSSHANLKSEL